jgi:hypothetical protein
MAGEWPQETGQRHEYDRVSLERRDEARLERENQVRKRQQVLTLSGGNGKRKGTDTARLLFEVSEFPMDFGGLGRLFVMFDI